MAITQLFFKKGNFISTVELDIIVQEGATATVKLTENPVENGANMNDHIIVEPLTFTVSGIVSNISSSALGQFSRAASIFSGGEQKAREAWDALLQLQIDRTPFTLVQGLKEYENVIILSLSEQQNKDTANGLFFNATLKEVIFAGTQLTLSSQFNDQNISDKMIPITVGGLKQLREI